jgi:hypothetical protein
MTVGGNIHSSDGKAFFDILYVYLAERLNQPLDPRDSDGYYACGMARSILRRSLYFV